MDCLYCDTYIQSNYSWYIGDTDNDGCIQCPNCNRFMVVNHECGIGEDYDCVEWLTEYTEN